MVPGNRAAPVSDFAIRDMGDYREPGYNFGRDTAHAVYIGGVRQIKPARQKSFGWNAPRTHRER